MGVDDDEDDVGTAVLVSSVEGKQVGSSLVLSIIGCCCSSEGEIGKRVSEGSRALFRGDSSSC